MADADDRPQDSAKAKAEAIALAEQAEAEAAEAEALAAAARARARAIKLRRAAQTEAEGEDEGEARATITVIETAETSETVETPDSSEPPAASTEPVRRRLVAPGLSRILTVAIIVVICGLLGVSGWMLRDHHSVVRERQRSAAFTAAAKQGVINLTSLDFNNAKVGVQRVLDSSTGEFRDDFHRQADDFASVVEDSKAVTEGSVAAAAVESMGRDSAVVLVLANERVTNSTGAKDEPRSFRFRVTVTRDGDQIKISKVEFVL